MKLVIRVRYFIIFLLFFIQISIAFASNTKLNTIPIDTVKISGKDFQANLDSLLNNFFVSQSLKINTNRFNFSDSNDETDIIPNFSDSVYIQRLQSLPSVIDMTYNDKVRAFIELYVNKKRKNVKVMLGLSQYYFPIFEEILDQQGVPQELKYLTIIESALNPRAVSRVGASGLWQFMYTTGKIYDLQVNSLVDERRDPIKASYAAAKYLKDLYGIYKDWTLALAAYNCGPGNVNKAIKRSKGKTNFWEIYDYLPQETRGYVPAFIAANYMMNYYKEHNLFPQKIDFPTLTDTVMVGTDMNLKEISEALNVPLQQLRDLNPQYKNDIIPGKSEAYSLKLPINLVTTFIQMEDTITAKSKESMLKYSEVTPSRNYLQISPSDDIIKISYKAQKGDNFSSIAKKYKVDADALKEWNHMRKKKIKPGQKLVIYTTKKGKSEKKEPKPFVSGSSEVKTDTAIHEKPESENKEVNAKNKEAKTSKKENGEAKPKTITYKVKKGDTISSISRKFDNVSVKDIIEWNKLGKNGVITPGQELKIKIQN
ncbi:MAG: LysM peptidoglycan-binding domain-containing protein [Bacteroidetes bacterium]|nr:LysM peptidoglycan-binding domain-containing protein [Bacteroidota bacterium]